MLGSAAKEALRLDRQSRTVVPLHNFSRTRSHQSTTQSQLQPSSHARALCCAFALPVACSLAISDSFACTIIAFFPSRLSNLHNISASLLSIPLLVRAITLPSSSCLHNNTTLSVPCTAKLGCNTGLQRSLCPSLPLCTSRARTIRPARSGAAFSSLTPPA